MVSDGLVRQPWHLILSTGPHGTSRWHPSFSTEDFRLEHCYASKENDGYFFGMVIYKVRPFFVLFSTCQAKARAGHDQSSSILRVQPHVDQSPQSCFRARVLDLRSNNLSDTLCQNRMYDDVIALSLLAGSSHPPEDITPCDSSSFLINRIVEEPSTPISPR